MSQSVVGTLAIQHYVDPNGSLCLELPIRVAPAKVSPDISIVHHSAVHDMSVLGYGWELRAFGLIQRTARTLAQDNVSGSVNYDANDRYTLNGQRLMHISGNEYRFEIEQWSKVVALGSNLANPDSWIEYRPDGTVRRYGSTTDSKALAQGQSATRIWALADTRDAFNNYASYSYLSADNSGSLFIDKIKYGGNTALSMDHQRTVTFSYGDRNDIETEFVGGSTVRLSKRLMSVTASFKNTLLHTYTFDYDYAPVTGITRLLSVGLLDASRASVTPLKFDWSDSPDYVFDNLVTLPSLKPGVSTALIFPVEVTGSGKTDVILTSSRYDSNSGMKILHLDVHLADGQGGISTTRQPWPSSTGLRYPDQLIPLDVNGDGKTDLLHIVKNVFPGNFALTILLSTQDGYRPQSSFVFTPEVLNGRFYSGDFEGNGNVGLTYIYVALDGSGSSEVRLVQLTSTGTSWNQRGVVHGPKIAIGAKVLLVTADFDGNGANDIFVMTPKASGASTVTQIDFFQSNDQGILTFKDKFFSGIGDRVPWTSTISFVALPEKNGNNGLLVLSQSNAGYLDFQTLRSTGKSLAVSDRTNSNQLYNGNISLGRTTSMGTLDLVNIFSSTGSQDVVVSVLHFFNGTFVNVKGVKQPPGSVLRGFDVDLTDLRGIGRADCLFTLYDHTLNELKLRRLPSAGSVNRPPDFLTGYTNGLGATLSVSYAPLTDSSVYSTSTKEGKAVDPFVNARFGLNRRTSQSASSTMGCTRSQLIQFPKYVVKEMTTCALPSSNPNVASKAEFFYTGGRVSFDGRGWLGFESIAQSSDVLGATTTNTYLQYFPFLGQVSKTEMRETAASRSMLKSTTYTWDSETRGQSTQCYTILSSSRETSFEKGSQSYTVDTAHTYDSYANLTSTTISTPGKPSLVIANRYANDAEKWIIGSLLSETVFSGGQRMKETNYTYLPNTQVVNQTKSWISATSFSVQDDAFDQAGNVTTSLGPFQAKKTLVYDETYTFPIQQNDYINDQSFLTTSASYNNDSYMMGQPSSVTAANGHIKAQLFDVLGRVVEMSEGRSIESMTVVEKREYTQLNGQAVCVRQNLCDPNSWSRQTSYVDGMGRVWKEARAGITNPSVQVYSEVLLDGAGRVVRRYRNYSEGSNRAYTAYEYDSLSRKTKVILPPATAGAGEVTVTLDYNFNSSNWQTTVTQSKYEKGLATPTVTKTVLEYFVNPNIHSTDNGASQGSTVPLTVSSVDELDQSVETDFDALHRVVGVTDPKGINISQDWDGISRSTSRKVSQSGSDIINHFTMAYDDAAGKTTVTNQCTGLTTVMLKDRLSRLIRRTTSDEDVSLVYDDVASGAQGQVSFVTSSKGVSEAFSYTSQGDTKTSSLKIDGQTLTTSFEYTTSRQLRKVTNPDGSIMSKTFYNNNQSVKHIQLQDGSSTTSVSSAYSDFDPSFLTPRLYSFGNGLKLTTTLAYNGAPASAVLSKGSTTIHQQTWKMNSSGRLVSHSQSSSVRNYKYNTGGLLVESLDPSGGSSAYSYDSSGNILTKDGKFCDNDGWQLLSINDQLGQLSRSFEYTSDGHLMTEKDGAGHTVRDMTYDALGRMTELNSLQFAYDYLGRMVKATSADGSVTYYPTDYYEHTLQGNTTTQTAYLLDQHRRASLTTVISEKSKETFAKYYHADHLGSVVAVTDENGNIVTTYSYDDFGQVTMKGPDSSRYKYSGKESFDGLYYFGARFYDPTTGRFTTLDNAALRLTGITPSTFNQYTFSRNDPINFIDFNGNGSFWWNWLWHVVVDVLLVVVGVAVTVFFPPAALLGTMLIGAGVSGLVNDAFAMINPPDNMDEYHISWGIGLALGGLTAPLGSVGSTLGKGVAKLVTSKLLNVAIRIGVQGGFGALVGLSAGVTNQFLFNVVTGKDLDEGLDAAAWMGAAGGFAGEGLGAGVGKIVKKGQFRVVGSIGVGEASRRAMSNTGRQVAESVEGTRISGLVDSLDGMFLRRSGNLSGRTGTQLNSGLEDLIFGPSFTRL